MTQSLMRGDLSTEFARRARAERFLRIRAALRAETARSAMIGVSRRRWWWPWSLFRNKPENLQEHLPRDGDRSRLQGDLALEQSKNFVHHQPQDREVVRPDYSAGAARTTPLAAAKAGSATPANAPRPPWEGKIYLVADHARR